MKRTILLLVVLIGGKCAFAEEPSALVGGVVPGYPAYSLGMPSHEPEKWGVTGDELYWDALSVFDGDSSTKMDDYAYYSVTSARGTIGFDAGTARHITGVRIKQTSSYGDRNQYFKLQGSNDGEMWTTVVENAGTVVGNAAFTEVAAKKDAGDYRYFRIVDSVVNDLTDVEIVSDDVLVKANPPQVWADTSLSAADATAGVLLSGTLVYAPSAAQVSMYVASRDWGADEEQWKARSTATVTLSDAVAAGGVFSARVKGLKAGFWYWRVFATAGEKTGASQVTRPFVVGSVDSAAPLYMNLKGTGSSDLYRIYDAALDSCFGNIATNTVWFTFDCSSVAGTHRPAVLRFWSVNQYRRTWNSLRGIKVDVSYDAVRPAADWTAAETSDWGGRMKYMGATEPEGLTWTTVSTGEAFTDVQAEVEELVLPKFDKNPTYIRIRDLYKGQAKEVQLRLVKRPSGVFIIVR